MGDKENLDLLTARPYKDQACWFLNAYWEDFGEKEAEKVWSFVKKCAELDENKRAEGSDLDEFQAHRFLEHFKETLTVQGMRDKLRSSGAIAGQVKRVPLLHILIFKYNIDWRQMINAPQGSKEEVAKAQALLDQVQSALRESQAKDQQAAAALREATEQEAAAKRAEADAKAREAEAKAREAEAKQREAEAKASEEQAKAREADAKARAAEASDREAEARAKEDELQAAKAELEAALADLKAQEDAFNGRTAELTRQSEEGSVVQKNRAKNELAQHLSSDPLPLRRAKITQEAAVKKADRAAQAAREAVDKASAARAAAEEAANQASQARKAAEQARANAEEAARQASQARAQAEEAARQASQARANAEESRRRSEEAKAAAEAALDEAQRKVAEAEAYLEEVKKRMPLGTAWWMDREIHEARAYLPKNKGGYNKRELGQV